MLIALLVLAVALLIPVVGILIDSPIGRAVARRVEGSDGVPASVTELARKVELLEGDVDDLHKEVRALREENQFLQRLLERDGERRSLPPDRTP